MLCQHSCSKQVIHFDSIKSRVTTSESYKITYSCLFKKRTVETKLNCELKYNANVITADNLNSHHDPLKPNQIHLSDYYTGIIEIQS